MNGKTWMLVGAILAGLSVILGAFGAHGLESQLGNMEPGEFAKRMENWRTGAMYQFFHALGIILIGIVIAITPQQPNRSLHLSAATLLIGVILFSWLLFLMALTDWKLGMIVPIGGLAYIVGWAMFAFGVYQLDFVRLGQKSE
jgi:uncharacterized membrane protein YgdD (TMEM256/DUF423 family)